ncbi:hypothetical protein P9112_003613 [Eukaryota sp. TZLM1-RC]
MSELLELTLQIFELVKLDYSILRNDLSFLPRIIEFINFENSEDLDQSLKINQSTVNYMLKLLDHFPKSDSHNSIKNDLDQLIQSNDEEFERISRDHSWMSVTSSSDEALTLSE